LAEKKPAKRNVFFILHSILMHVQGTDVQKADKFGNVTEKN